MSGSFELVRRYVVGDEIGSGGMARVRIARMLGPVGFAKTVAIKTLHPHVAKNVEFVGMLLDEARIMARVRHPNVVQILDVSVSESEVALVLDYVHGDSLSHLVKAASDVPIKIALRIVSDVLRGLHAAHLATSETGEPLGIVHRDVSPHNILVGFDGVSRVMDFGIAKAVGRAHVTKTGEVKGKLGYMAPEQFLGLPLGRGADIFSVGVVLWELTAGGRLFVETSDEVADRASDFEMPPLPNTVDPALDAIVRRALERDVGARYDSAAAMAADIELLGPASVDEVATWMASVSPSLGERTRRLRDFERDAAAAAPLRARQESESTFGVREPARAIALAPKAPAGRRRTLAAAFAIALLVVIGLSVFAIVSRRTPALPAVVAPQPVSPSPIEPSAVPPSASAPSVASPPATPRLPRTPPRSTSPRPGPQPPPSVATSRPKAACDPPYTLDAEGNKTYKRECLTR